MRNLLAILLLLVVSSLAFGNAPPITSDDMNLEQVVVSTQDNVLLNATAYVDQDVVYTLEEKAEVVEMPVYDFTVLVVPEVAYSRKYLVNTTASRYATETKAENAVLLCSTDLNIDTNKFFLDTSKEKLLPIRSRNFINKQHSNFGYPLSAE